MPVKIRLQRHGKKGKPFYWIVAADGRAKRDGKYLEKLGTYNPNVNPAEINLDVDGTVKWLNNGAQPTNTAKNILSYKGVLLKKHLAGGVSKGALTEEQAEEKFNAWISEKEDKIESKRNSLSKAKEKEKEDALTAEKVVNEKRIAEAVPVVEVVEEVAKEKVTKEEEEAPKKETIDDVAQQAAEETSKGAKVEETEALAEIKAEATKEEEAPKEETSKDAKVEDTTEAPAEVKAEASKEEE